MRVVLLLFMRARAGADGYTDMVHMCERDLWIEHVQKHVCRERVYRRAHKLICVRVRVRVGA